MKRGSIPWMLALVLAATGARAEGPAGIKIGVFDAPRLTEETAEGRKVQATLSSLRDKKQAEIEGKQKEIQGLQTQLQTQGLSLSPEKRASMEKDIQKKVIELEQIRDAAQKEMQLEIGEAQGKFQQQLLTVIESFGKDEGFELILERSLVAFANPAIDVTTALVDRFNKMVPSTPEKPAEKPAEKPSAPPTKKP